MSEPGPAPEIEHLLAWMQGVVTHPGGIRASDDGRLGETVTRSRRLSEAERLAIYSSAYHTRLLHCFESEYPCLRHALGEELFANFVRRYLDRYPPVSYTLLDLSDRFIQFLEETRPDAAKPPQERESWPDFIIELASLERIFLKTFNGAGPEEGELLCCGDLPASDEALAALKFRPVESVSVHTFRYPVVEYFKATRAGEEPELPDADSDFLAINRRNYVVMFHQLDETQIRFLDALLTDQLTVAEASQRLGTPGSGQLRSWLESWTENQFFRPNEPLTTQAT